MDCGLDDPPIDDGVRLRQTTLNIRTITRRVFRYFETIRIVSRIYTQRRITIDSIPAADGYNLYHGRAVPFSKKYISYNISTCLILHQ